MGENKEIPEVIYVPNNLINAQEFSHVEVFENSVPYILKSKHDELKECLGILLSAYLSNNLIWEKNPKIIAKTKQLLE